MSDASPSPAELRPEPCPEPCDVLVIGGGPAGSTAAALLARRGADVVLLEKDAHPRFHIGESLLPRNMPIFERLGVRAEVEAMGVYKPGAEFVSDRCGRSMAYPFSLAMRRDCTHSYQVRRAELDALLFDNAGRAGARTHQNACATDIVLPKGNERGSVRVETEAGPRRFAPRFVLDASGRDTFMATRLDSKDADRDNHTAAVYAHYRHVGPHRAETEGYITIHLVEDGWFWSIPLPDGITSIGFVGNRSAFKERRGTMADLLADRIAASATLAPRMRGAELASEIRTAGNYSYRARRAWGEGYHMIGDAFAFLDPLFSSGVLLAMTSGELGAGVAASWLNGAKAGRAASRAAERRMRREMDGIRWLICRIHHPVLRFMFMQPNNKFRMRDGLVSILSGDLRGSWRAAVPVLCFKTVFHLLRLARRADVPIPGLTREWPREPAPGGGDGGGGGIALHA